MSNLTTAPMADFSLRWRFTDRKHHLLPAADLERIKPLDAGSAARLLDSWSDHSMPPSAEAFANIARVGIGTCDGEATAGVGDWLRSRNVAPAQEVFAIWDRRTAAMTTWELFAGYWSAFWYPGSDDLMVFDASRTWVLFLSHEEEAFFASTAA